MMQSLYEALFVISCTLGGVDPLADLNPRAQSWKTYALCAHYQLAAAEGDRAYQDRPKHVGERGPEAFVPSVPGTVVPRYSDPASQDFGVYRERPGQEMPAIGPRPEAWDRWLANAPESENIEDRRGPDATDMDEIRWRRAHEPKKPLKQFPPAETDAKRTVPDWLKDQESQWLKANKKQKP
jgi:hypothetical protein